MVFRKAFLAACLFAALPAALSAGGVTFHNPVPWTTIRSTMVDVRASVDTAGMTGKKLSVQFCRWQGGSMKLLASDTVVIGETSYEHSFNAGSAIGGADYCSVSWEVAGTPKKGQLGPLGVASVADSMRADITAASAGESFSIDSALASEGASTKIGGSTFSARWNSKGLFLRISADSALRGGRFNFDAKNGKNAFLAFADRRIDFSMDADTMTSVYAKRVADSTMIRYSDTRWNGDMKIKRSGRNVAVLIPWYDLGMKAVASRILGFSLSLVDASGAATKLPESSDYQIPATWGNLLLAP